MKPLSRKFRRGLFWGLFAVFVVGTPILIGYSQGYRLDDALELIQTGGIYIHSDLANTNVFLNGEFVEDNGVLIRNTLIQDLTPNRSYELWVEKEGLQSWVKILRVQPNLVTEARVFMLPETLEWETIPATSTLRIAGTVTTASTSASSTTVVANPAHVELQTFFTSSRDQFEVEIATTTYTYVGAVRVATTTILREIQFPGWLETLASTSALSDKTMVRERDGVVAWLDNGNIHATWARTDEAAPYFFCNTTATCTPEFLIDWEEPIERYNFYPNRNDVVLVSTNRGLFAIELDNRSQRNIQVVSDTPSLDFRIDTNDVLITFDGTVFKTTSW